MATGHIPVRPTFGFFVLRQVEFGHDSSTQVTGLVLDLSKAYNNIPRFVALATAQLMGVHHDVICAWAGALAQMKRHFCVRDSVSPGLWSTRGLPEGCGMSIIGMMAVTTLFHEWLRSTLVRPRVLSFVDNWEVLVESADQACLALDRVLEFTNLLDMPVDVSKTFFWSTDPVTRQTLRRQGKPVRLTALDLGAHMVFGKQLSNAHLVARLRGLESFWMKLQRALGSHADKVRVVVTAAWPRGLHAGGAAVLGKKHLVAQRACYMRALHLDKPGANAWLQCAVDHPMADPLFYLAQLTVRDLRTFGAFDESRLALARACQADFHAGFGSVSSVAVSRLQKLGFQVNDSGLIVDDLGIFDVLTCSFREFGFRSQLAWTKTVAQAVVHRSDFQGFEHVDIGATRAALRKLTLPDQGIMWRILNGSMQSNDLAYHWSDTGSPLCVFCQQQDTLEHRWWQCPHTAVFRNLRTTDFQQRASTFPAAARIHGWFPRSPSVELWCQALLALPEPCPEFEKLPSDLVIDLFTDGSAFWPSCSAYRVAAWSVVAMPPLSDDPQPSQATVLQAQPLCGLIQTPGRAELRALVGALEHVARCNWWGRIWLDCQYVHNGFLKYVLAKVPVKHNVADSDLWVRVTELMDQIGSQRVRVIKIPAHTSASDEDDCFDLWMRLGNHLADRAADLANRWRGSAFWHFWFCHAEQVEACRLWGEEMVQHIVDCTHLSAQHFRLATAVETPKPESTRRVRIFEPTFADPGSFDLQKPTFVRLFSAALGTKFQLWFQRVFDANEDLRWVSFWQLFVDFVNFGERTHIAKIDGKWQVTIGQEAFLANHWALSLRVKWFRLAVQQFLKDCGIAFKAVTTKPYSHWIKCQRGCLGFRLNKDVFHRVESWFATSLGTPAIGQGEALSSLPDPHL